MSLFNFFKRKHIRAGRPRAAAGPARPRAHHRRRGGKSDLVAHPARGDPGGHRQAHVGATQDNVQIKMDRGASVSTLEVDIEIPTPIAAGMRPAA